MSNIKISPSEVSLLKFIKYIVGQRDKSLKGT